MQRLVLTTDFLILYFFVIFKEYAIVILLCKVTNYIYIYSKKKIKVCLLDIVRQATKTNIQDCWSFACCFF